MKLLRRETLRAHRSSQTLAILSKAVLLWSIAAIVEADDVPPAGSSVVQKGEDPARTKWSLFARPTLTRAVEQQRGRLSGSLGFGADMFDIGLYLSTLAFTNSLEKTRPGEITEYAVHQREGLSVGAELSAMVPLPVLGAKIDLLAGPLVRLGGAFVCDQYCDHVWSGFQLDATFGVMMSWPDRAKDALGLGVQIGESVTLLNNASSSAGSSVVTKRQSTLILALFVEGRYDIPTLTSRGQQLSPATAKLSDSETRRKSVVTVPMAVYIDGEVDRSLGSKDRNRGLRCAVGGIVVLSDADPGVESE
jgi:hypothetical protein